MSVGHIAVAFVVVWAHVFALGASPACPMHRAAPDRGADPGGAPSRPEAQAPTPTVPEATDEVTYIVRWGDTLHRIARTYGVDLRQLATANGIANPNHIYAGQVLVLPTPEGRVPPAPSATPTPTPAPSGDDEAPARSHLTRVLLLGADGTAQWRTDGIMLVLYNTQTRRAGILSIPRDLWVTIPGYGSGRINTVDYLGEQTDYPGGGPALLRAVLEENLGLTFDHYARIRFDGFMQVIDTVGGIDVTVEEPIEDIFPHPSRPGELLHMDLKPGPARLDGPMALAYARSRLSTSDFDRSRRQQQILTGLWRKLIRPESIRYVPELYGEFIATITTDLPLSKVLQLAHAGVTVRPEDVETLVIDLRLTKNWMTPRGSAVLLPVAEKLQGALRDFMATLERPPRSRAVGALPYCWGCPE